MRKQTWAWVLTFSALSTAPSVGQGLLPGSDARPIACAFNTALPTIAAGQLGIVQCDANGRLIISNPGSGGGALTRSAEVGTSTAADGIVPTVTQSGTSAVGKTSAGNLYSAYAINTTTTAGYLICLNTAATPASGSSITPTDVAALGGVAGAGAQINYGAGPPNVYSTGITCLISTSLSTYVPGGAAFIQTRVR